MKCPQCGFDALLIDAMTAAGYVRCQVCGRQFADDWSNTKIINSYLLYEQEIRNRLTDGSLKMSELIEHGIQDLSKAVSNVDRECSECKKTANEKQMIYIEQPNGDFGWYCCYKCAREEMDSEMFLNGEREAQ